MSMVVVALVLLLTPPVGASTTGIISGVVTDTVTGAKLSGVNIVVKGTDLTTVTDANGYFVITNVAPGSYEVVASLVGYTDTSKTDIQVMMDATGTADVQLTKTVIEAPEAVVTANPGCYLQLAAGLRAHPAGVRLLHLAEVLSRGYGIQ